MKICIDAGHFGAYNQSPADSGYFESRVMWRLHLLLCEELLRRGFEVKLTRDDQERDLPLFERGKCAFGCDLFLSLHSNAVGESVNGEIDYPVAYVSSSKQADEIGLLLARAVEKVMNTKQSARIEHRLNSAKTADYYGVLRGAASVGVSGVILEHSFHTNPRAVAFLQKEENLRALACAEAQVLAQHFGVSAEAKEATTAQRYKYLNDIPANWDEEGNPRAAVRKLMEAGFLKGSGNDGGGEVLDLSRDMLRLLVLLCRAGAFGDI